MLPHRNSHQINFGENELNLIRIIGNQISTAIHRHELAEKIQFQAYHDDLTGLPNRRQFRNLLVEHLDRAKATGETVALVFIDLDGFKNINDSLGHAVGDKLLSLVAQRFRNCIKESDVLARMSGGEFAIIVNNSPDKNKTTDICQRVLDSLNNTLVINKREISVGASIGISYFPEHANILAGLLKTSDIAMYDAKRRNSSGITSFNP